MSRCFPFPPPGYERKARTDDVDLLKKEKHRERKHKKEKKDKGKGESKGKREKERSDGKHSENKDKKEKQRDKQDRDKDKNRISDEKRLPGQTEGHNGEKSSDEKKLSGKPEGLSGERFIQREKEMDKDRSSMSGEKKVVVPVSGYNGEKLSQNSHLAQDFKDSKFVQELGQRIKDEEEGTANLLAQKFTSMYRNKDEGMVRLLAKTTGTWVEQNEKNKDKSGEDRMLDGQGIWDEARSRSSMGKNLAGMVQIRVERMPKPLDKDVEGQSEMKAKTKQKKGDDKHGDKLEEKYRLKKRHGKDKDTDKDKKLAKAKEKSEQKKTELDKLQESNKDDHISSHNMKISHPLKDRNKSADTEGNLRKRKDFDAKGFSHANDIVPNKLARPTSASNPLTENGRILEPSQTSVPSTSDRRGLANNIKTDNKERKINGMIEAQPLSASSTKPSLTIAQADQIVGVTMKPPHPDLKYLSQVLTVPKIEEWPDFDDQEWLFQSCDTQVKKPKMGFSGADKTPQVWAEPLRIDSADIFALPYVIPY